MKLTIKRDKMKMIEAIAERASDGTWCVYCKDEIFSGMGKTLLAAKEDMRTQMEGYRVFAVERGIEYPSFLDGKWEVRYTFQREAVSV